MPKAKKAPPKPTTKVVPGTKMTLKDKEYPVDKISAKGDFNGTLTDLHNKGWKNEIKRAIELVVPSILDDSKLDTILKVFDPLTNSVKRGLLKALGLKSVYITNDTEQNLYSTDFELKEYKNDEERKNAYRHEIEEEQKKEWSSEEEGEGTQTPPSPPKTTTTQVQPESPPPKPSKGAPKPTAQNAEAQEVEAEEHRKKEEKKIAVQERRVIDIPKAFKLIDKTNIGKQSNRLRAHDIHNTIKNTMNTEVKPVATVAKMDELQAKRDAHFKFSFRKLKFNRPSDISQKSKQMLF
jgi:hypothetical protein